MMELSASVAASHSEKTTTNIEKEECGVFEPSLDGVSENNGVNNNCSQPADSRMVKLRKRLSQGLRLSFTNTLSKESNLNVEAGGQTTETDAQDDNARKQSVRRVHSDTEPTLPGVQCANIGKREKLRRSYSENPGDLQSRPRSVSFTSPPESPFGKMAYYSKLELLGEGSYASVFKGISNVTKQTVALKEIRLQPEEGAPFTAIREASLLKELKHANIVKLHDIVHTKDTLMFVFEYLHTDLSHHLEKFPNGVHPHNAKLYLLQLLRGLTYCHERRILHRDIKPQNLLLNDNGELKLADFGLAREKSVPSHTFSNEVVTLWYRPPDVLLGSTDYSTSLDMWGVGCIFGEMLGGRALFQGQKGPVDQLNKIWQILGTPSKSTWPEIVTYPEYSKENFPGFSPRKMSSLIPVCEVEVAGEDLLKRLLQYDPKRRISADDSLNHPYFHDLPRELFKLHESLSVFSIPGVSIVHR